MRKLSRADILDPGDYAARRRDLRRANREAKRHRRVEVGPFVAFYFENRETMWHQVHEMLHIERGGEEQIRDELAAYNPLVPEGRDLRCTMMIEIDDPTRREAALRRLGWIDETVAIRLGPRSIAAEPLQDAERNRTDGKTSSIHFLVFRFDDAAVALFRDPSVRATLGIDHGNYGHMAVLASPVRAALAGDFSSSP